MSTANNSLIFAKKILPYFEGNPMYPACIEHINGIVVVISEPKEPSDNEPICNYQIDIRLFTPSTDEYDNMEPAVFGLSLCKTHVEELKTMFLDLFGLSTVRRTFAFTGNKADPIYLKDSSLFKDTDYFGIENNDGEVIMVGDKNAPKGSFNDIVEYEVIKTRPYLKEVV